MTPDKEWLPFLKLLIGLLMFLSLVGLAMVIGLGHVEQNSSFGLQDVLGGLLVAFGSWAQWSFGGSRKDDDK
jgi:hypothetical protein